MNAVLDKYLGCKIIYFGAGTYLWVKLDNLYSKVWLFALNQGQEAKTSQERILQLRKVVLLCR